MRRIFCFLEFNGPCVVANGILHLLKAFAERVEGNCPEGLVTLVNHRVIGLCSTLRFLFVTDRQQASVLLNRCAILKRLDEHFCEGLFVHILKTLKLVKGILFNADAHILGQEMAGLNLLKSVVQLDLKIAATEILRLILLQDAAREERTYKNENEHGNNNLLHSILRNDWSVLISGTVVSTIIHLFTHAVNRKIKNLLINFLFLYEFQEPENQHMRGIKGVIRKLKRLTVVALLAAIQPDGNQGKKRKGLL